MAKSDTPENSSYPHHLLFNSHHGKYRFCKITPNSYGAFDTLIALFEDIDTNSKTTEGKNTSCNFVSKENIIPPGKIPLHLPSSVSGDEVSFTITIFHINDLHHQLFHRSRDFSPPARMGAMISKARSKAEVEKNDVLFLSAGDDHIGSIFDAMTNRASTSSYSPSPVYRCLSALGLDATTLGNHDFDLDLETLLAAIEKDANFPVLSANIEVPHKNYFSALLAVPKNTKLTLGIIGLSTLEEMHLREDPEKGIIFYNPEEKAGEIMSILEEHADLVIVLSHLGYNRKGSSHTVEYDDNKLAGYLSGVTSVPVIIIGGHTHTAIDHNKEPVVTKNIPLFQAGSHGTYLGRIDIKIDITDNRKITWKSRLLRIEDLPEDLPFERAFLQNHLIPLEQDLSKRLGETLTIVYTDNTADSASTAEDRLSGECSLANFIADTLAEIAPSIIKNSIDIYTAQALIHTIEEGRAIAASDGAGINDGFEDAQEVTVKSWYETLPYPDTLYYALITERELTDIVVSNARRIIPKEWLSTHGGYIDLQDWSHISRGFLHFSRRLRYTVLQEAIRNRRDMNIDNKTDSEVEKQSIMGKVGGMTLFDRNIPGNKLFVDKEIHSGEDEPVLFLVNSHTALGFQGWGSDKQESFYKFGAFDMTALPFSDTGVPIRDMIIDYCRKKAFIEVKKDGRLSIKSPQGHRPQGQF